MQESERDAVEPSAAIYAEKQEHEEHFSTLHDAREVLQAQGCIEVLAALLMQGCYLCIDIMQGFFVSIICRVREIIWIIIGIALMKVGNKRE